MDQNEDPEDLERKIEQASRIASRIDDQTTVERLSAWIQDLKQRLLQRREARRTKQRIGARAREIWEQNGRPADRDLEFWLQAESEISERRREVIDCPAIGRSDVWRRLNRDLDQGISSR